MVSEIDIEIDGKKLTSIREACSEVSYSRDYVNRLAREGKIVASLIGRQWFVDVLSLKNYAVQSKVEAELRKAQLSEERKQEQIFQKTKQQQKLSHQKSTSSVGTRAVLASGSVLALGLAAGVIGYSVFTTSFGFDFQMSQSQSDGAPNSQLAASAKANAVSPEPNSLAASAPDFSTKAVTAFASAENGILILPQSEGGDPAAVFSDEVHIQTATSGEQTAVLVDTDGVSPDREVPFVLVPVKTAQN